MQKFNTGDTVFLTSGSPRLRVTAAHEDEITVEWKNRRTGEMRSWTFESWTLTHDESAYVPGLHWDNPLNKKRR